MRIYGEQRLIITCIGRGATKKRDKNMWLTRTNSDYISHSSVKHLRTQILCLRHKRWTKCSFFKNAFLIRKNILQTVCIICVIFCIYSFIFSMVCLWSWLFLCWKKTCNLFDEKNRMQSGNPSICQKYEVIKKVWLMVAEPTSIIITLFSQSRLFREKFREKTLLERGN